MAFFEDKNEVKSIYKKGSATVKAQDAGVKAWKDTGKVAVAAADNLAGGKGARMAVDAPL